MTLTTPVQPLPSRNWQSKSPGFSELSALLELYPDAALIIEGEPGIVLLANNQFASLVSEKPQDVIGQNISDLLPFISGAELSPQDVFDWQLNRKNKEPIGVRATVHQLDASNQWYVITLTPTGKSKEKYEEIQRQTQVIPLIEKLIPLSGQRNLSKILLQALEIGNELLGTDLLYIYKAEGKNPQLQKYSSWIGINEDLLPDILSSTSLARLNAPTLWSPAIRPTTDLHQAALKANLAYVASAPIGQESAWSGLVVAADRVAPNPDREILPLISLFCAVVTNVIEHQVLITNLESRIERNQLASAFQDRIFDNSREGIILLNNNLAVVEMNPTAELLLGYACHEVKNMDVDSVLISREPLKTAISSSLFNRTTTNLGNINLHRRNGQSFLAHVQAVPAIGEEKIFGIIIFMLDVSQYEQIRLQTQQLEQRAVLGEITAIFAHEVRNPINNISTGLQLLEMNATIDPPSKELIGRLQQDCNRLTHLMESVLSFSKPMEYRLEPIDLSLLIKRILDKWRSRFASLKITSFFQEVDFKPLVSGDPRALEQVFTNLISNACQAMSELGGTLAIKIQSINPSSDLPLYEVSISDTGPGIPEDIREHIFEPFMTTTSQGTGLGLAITKRIVGAHKGSISVDSFPGGTVFKLRLPSIQE